LQTTGFEIVEASISDHLSALNLGTVTSVDLVTSYLNRIAVHDTTGGLNAFTVFNPYVLEEASASDARRAQGLRPRPLEGIPYTLKDSYKYAGLSVTNGSPALKGLMSNEDSAIAAKLRNAGAVLIGKTNMPPMAAGGMQRGLYGRAESPYNSKYLTAAFSSGSSNGAATSTASSMAVFGMGSETVSSGRSPASNNALVCYTPSRGILSCRGLWPLYVTCDVPVPYARSIPDLLAVLDVIATPDEQTKGDFWREQTHVSIPAQAKVDYTSAKNPDALRGKRIGVPKMYVGQRDSDPHAKHPYVSPETIQLWERASRDLEMLGAEIVYTDFPLVTRYENDSESGEANNISGAPSDWNAVERGVLIAKAWDDFLLQNADTNLRSLTSIRDPKMLFPKPTDYIPDMFLEVRNWIDYAGLSTLLPSIKETAIADVPGLAQAVCALEAQRTRDLEDWMTSLRLDALAFPAQGDVGPADLETNAESTKLALQNGVKYSNGNRALRHLGVPTVSVPMGVLEGKGMPMNLTFAGRAYGDAELLGFAFAFEERTKRRTVPGLTPGLATDVVAPNGAVEGGPALELRASVRSRKVSSSALSLSIAGEVFRDVEDAKVQIFLDGKEAWNGPVEGKWSVDLEHTPSRPECLGWDLKPLEKKRIMVLVVAEAVGTRRETALLWADIE
jgi:Asp-tRNA(Asn)/Glu-tRNA(Gln) amidotransferase A subunit family amidase